MSRSKTPGLIKRDGTIWHYDILVDGIRYRGSTHTLDLKTASLFLNQLRLDIARGRLALKDTRRTLLLEEVHREFMASKKASSSPLYIASITAHWRVWLEPRLGRVPIDKIHALELDQLRNALLEAGRSQVFTNNVLITLRTHLNFAVKRGKLRIALKVQLLRVHRKPRPTLPISRVHAFLAAIDQGTKNPQVRVMVRVMLGLGCRISEVTGMRWEWLDLEQRLYRVGRAKGFECRVLPVPSWVWDALTSLPTTHLSGLIFPARTGGRHCPGFLRKSLTAAAKKVGVGHLTAHRLRASFATNMELAGAPVTAIQEMLGHKDLKTTLGYLETSLEAKRKAQDSLSRQIGFVEKEARCV